MPVIVYGRSKMAGRKDAIWQLLIGQTVTNKPKRQTETTKPKRPIRSQQKAAS